MPTQRHAGRTYVDAQIRQRKFAIVQQIQQFAGSFGPALAHPVDHVMFDVLYDRQVLEPLHLPFTRRHVLPRHATRLPVSPSECESQPHEFPANACSTNESNRRLAIRHLRDPHSHRCVSMGAAALGLTPISRASCR